MPINPIAKLNFMRKRLAHGIKRTGQKAYTGEKKLIQILNKHTMLKFKNIN